jgi:uncharacterized membrane protein (DUF4010 family)
MEGWEPESVAFRLAVALGVGLLVGLQREKQGSPLAGLRTFALTALLGGVAAILSELYGPWILAASLVGLAALVVMGNVAKLRAGYRDPGLTTEVALLLVFLLGAYLQAGSLEVGVVLAGVTALLLHAKARFRGWMTRLGKDDVTAIMRFALLSLVILPILPDRTFGPFEVLNPRNIWWMVVLIVGIGLGGYLAYRFLGERAGTALGGILGGMISSTATTLSYSRRSGSGSLPPELAAVVIMIASAVVFVRVLVEISVVAPGAVAVALPPLALLLAVFSVLSWAAWRSVARAPGPMPEQKNPSELVPALVFGALYALILVGVAAATEWFGSQGLYVVALISGLTDMDAITLSTARLTREGRLDAGTLWRVVVVASVANLVFKLSLATALGGRPLLRRLGPLYALGAGAALLVLWLWPG